MCIKTGNITHDILFLEVNDLTGLNKNTFFFLLQRVKNWKIITGYQDQILVSEPVSVQMWMVPNLTQWMFGQPEHMVSPDMLLLLLPVALVMLLKLLMFLSLAPNRTVVDRLLWETKISFEAISL